MVPKDYEEMKLWFPLIRRMRRELAIGNNSIISLTLVCDSQRNPVLWGQPTVSQLEPRGRSIKFELTLDK